jgi:hypothetical protein
MLQAIINFFKPRPAPQPLSEQVYEVAIQAVRDEMGRQPVTRENPATQLSFEEFRTLRRKKIRPAKAETANGRPRKWGFYDLEVGESCRVPNRPGIGANAYHHGKKTGKVFTTRARSNGLWIKRVA